MTRPILVAPLSSRKFFCLWFGIIAMIASASCNRQEFVPAGNRSLNVLVITLDTIRADRLGDSELESEYARLGARAAESGGNYQ